MILILTQISWTKIYPDQISATYIGIRPITLSRLLSSRPWHCNKFQLTWALTKYLQLKLGLTRSPSGLKQLCCQTPHPPRLFQQTPQPLGLSPIDVAAPWNIVNRLQGFQTRRCGSSGAIWNIDSRSSSGMLVGSTGYLPLKNILLSIFYIIVARAPFSIKINVTVDFSLSVFVPWLKPRINFRKNYLNTTTFS